MSSNDDGRGGARPHPNSNAIRINRGWITIDQLAVLLHKDYRTIRRWCQENRVINVKVGAQIRIYEDEVRYILENGTRDPTHKVAYGKVKEQREAAQLEAARKAQAQADNQSEEDKT